MRWSSRNPTQPVAQHTRWATSFSTSVVPLFVLILVLAERSRFGRDTGRPSDSLGFTKVNAKSLALGTLVGISAPCCRDNNKDPCLEREIAKNIVQQAADWWDGA